MQLLLAVNVFVSVLLCGLLFWQYEEKMERAVREKRASLTDEAIAVHAAIAHLYEDHGADSVQSYIDTVCREMRNTWSPHHHIVVEFGDIVHSDGASQSTSCFPFHEIDSMQRISDLDAEALTGHVIGTHTDKLIRVLVSETTDTIRRAARRDVHVQLAVFGLAGALATFVVNVVLIRIVGVPLREMLAVVDRISAGEFGVHAPEFHTREMQQLALGINSMSTTLAENDRERQLQMCKARQIQQHLLPNGVVIPQLKTAHIFEPADSVAGDYYDFLPLSNGRWLVCLADVTGHGVPAAMGATILKALLLSESRTESFDLLAAMDNINRRFAEAILPGNFASMFLGCWRPATLELEYVSAGHEPAILLRASGSIEELESTGTLLGIDSDSKWDVRLVQLSNADRVLLFSDGATESHASNGELFGRRRLAETLTSYSACGEFSTLTHLFRDITEFRCDRLANDDLTLVLLTCDEATDETSFDIQNRHLTHDTHFHQRLSTQGVNLSMN